MKYKLNYIVKPQYLDIHGIELCSQTESEMHIEIHQFQKYLLNKNILELNSIPYLKLQGIIKVKLYSELQFTPSTLFAYFIAIKTDYTFKDFEISSIVSENGYYCISSKQQIDFAFYISVALYELELNAATYTLHYVKNKKYFVKPKTILYIDLYEHAKSHYGLNLIQENLKLALLKFGYEVSGHLVYYPLHKYSADFDDVFGDYVGYVNWNAFRILPNLRESTVYAEIDLDKQITNIKQLGYKFIKLNYLTSYSLYESFNVLPKHIVAPVNETSDNRNLFVESQKFIDILLQVNRLQNSALPLKVYSVYENTLAYEVITLTLIKQKNPLPYMKSLINVETAEPIIHPLFDFAVKNNNTFCGIVSQHVQDKLNYRSESTIILSLTKIARSLN